MATAQLGLNTSNFTAPALFLGWNWFYAYCVLASRTAKQYYGIDHNANPRQDLKKYADVAIREGKITQKQVDQIQRIESASANSVEGYTLFAASVLFALVTKVPDSTLKKACTVYTAARLLYGTVYVFVADDTYSQMRGVAWWTANISCLFLLWKGAQQI